jgi:Fe-Mn family superoxide dismutase
MAPNGGSIPTGKINETIVNSFGSYDKFKEQFSEAAAGHFGSGWAWLVRDENNKVRILIFC